MSHHFDMYDDYKNKKAVFTTKKNKKTLPTPNKPVVSE